MNIDRLFALAMALTPLPALAQARAEAPPTAALPPAQEPRVTAGSGVFGGTRVDYRATVEEFRVRGAGAAPGAAIVTTSYVRTGKGADRDRPVIFAFNGGPGSASIWLHMGFLGPRRVDMDDVEHPRTTPPFVTVANTDSPLDVADIVLIDPPGTGWSRVLPDGKIENFYGVRRDALATVQVIRDWLARHDRANAPKYLLSESYGTIRAAAVAKLLAGGPTETGDMAGLTLNGVILIGQSMDLTAPGEGDTRFANLLPTLAATACHFGKGPAGCTPAGQAQAAQRFAVDRYASALYAGSVLPAAERSAVVAQLSALSGLPAASIDAADLRIDAYRFASSLLAGEGRRLGMYDARFTLPAQGSGGDPVADDPAMGQYVPAFVAAWQRYATDVLKVDGNAPYRAIEFRSINAVWDYGFGPGVPRGRNYTVDLAAAMTRNPAMRLLVGTGYYDLVTPYGSAAYEIAHNGIPLSRTTLRGYESGHMAYLGAAPRAALARDIRAFVSVR